MPHLKFRVALEDSDLPVNAPLSIRRPRLKFSGKRQLTRLPRVPLSTVKLARQHHGVTLNDVVMAASTGAIRGSPHLFCQWEGSMFGSPTQETTACIRATRAFGSLDPSSRLLMCEEKGQR